MRLIDEEELEMQKLKNKKIKRIIMILIVLLLLIGAGVVALILYRVENPTQVTTYIDGKLVQNFDQILDFATNENGETEIYVPIRDFASYLNSVNKEFNYQTFKGDYNPKTEEEDKCYVLRSGYEVAIYTQKTKTIYKVNLQKNDSEYEECNIDRDIFESNGKLYTSVDGIEKGYNVSFSYDEKKKTIRIYTLDYLVNSHKLALEGKTIGNYGTMNMDERNYTNCKSIFEGLLIVQAENGKYGIVETENYASFILEPQYDNINFVRDSSTFLVESNQKVGLFSKEGKRKINLIYDEITTMGQNSNLYVVKSNNTYGVVDGEGNIILYPEYEKIGTDVSSFSYNGVKNGYIILNQVIPVLQNKKWAFFDMKGNMVTDGFIYQTIGCTNIKSGNNIYPLLVVPDYNSIVVQDEDGKYSFINTKGKEMLQFLFDQIYIKVSSGKTSYCMTYKEKEYEVLPYLKQAESN